MICPKCKTENNESAKFCLSCGTDLRVNQKTEKPKEVLPIKKEVAKKVEKPKEESVKEEISKKVEKLKIPERPKTDYSKPIKPLDSKEEMSKLKKILFYKEETDAFVLSKTKIISLVILVIFFIIGLYISFTTPTIEGNAIIKILASFTVGLMAAVPAYIIGILIRKFA